MEWKDVTGEDHIIDLDGLDPYAGWLIRDSGRFAFPKEFDAPGLYPLTLELRNISIADFADGKGLFSSQDKRQLWRESIALPPILTLPPPVLSDLVNSFEVTTAVARQSFFKMLRDPSNEALRGAIRSLTISRPLDKLPSFDEKVRQTPPTFDVEIHRNYPRSKSVVVGIIDDGIAFAHERFRDGPTTTRIASLWLQSQQITNASPTLFGRGREFTKEDIDQLLNAAQTHGRVDEDRVYRDAGVADFAEAEHKSLARRASHGTHVLDIATGPQRGSNPTWPIVCVQLPSAVTADTSGALLTQWAIEGVWYILLQSLRVAAKLQTRPIPVVINLSYGFTAGPHDGSHPLERLLQRAVDVWQQFTGAPVRIVLPAGNNLQSRLHAQFTFDKSQSIELPWRIHPDDRTASHVEIWLPRRPSRTPCPVRVSVQPPGGAITESPPIGEPGTTALELRSETQLLCQLNYGYSGGRGVVRISVAPTFELERSGAYRGAPAGIWTIRIENTELSSAEEVHAWVQRDDSAFGFRPLGRQSYFDDPQYERFDALGQLSLGDESGSLVRRAGSLNAIATGNDPRIVVVGGYIHASRRLARYSSWGPTLGTRHGPDALEVSDRSSVLHGRLGAGTRSGSRVAMNGTSVAAPSATRRIAYELAAGHAGDAGWLASIASADGGLKPEYGGAGLILASGIGVEV
jgi:hypothetical protein